MFLKFSNGQYIRSRYVESFNFYEQNDFDKKRYALKPVAV